MIVPAQKFCPFNGTISTKSEVGKSGSGYEELENYQCGTFLSPFR